MERNECIELLIKHGLVDSSSDLDGVSDEIVESMVDDIDYSEPAKSADPVDLRVIRLEQDGFKRTGMGTYAKNGREITMMSIRGLSDRKFDEFIESVNNPEESIVIPEGKSDLEKDKDAFCEVLKYLENITYPDVNLDKSKKIMKDIKTVITKTTDFIKEKMP